MNEDVIIREILQHKKGIFILDGPSGCGKSRLVRKIAEQVDDVKIISIEKVGIELNKHLSERKSMESIVDLFKCKILCIEDVDLETGKAMRQWSLADMANKIADKSIVIFNGIHIEERVPELVSHLQHPQIIYMTKGN